MNNCWLEITENEIIYKSISEYGGITQHFNTNGKLHKLDGPACIHSDNTNFYVYEFWVNGKQIGKWTSMDNPNLLRELEFKVMLYAE